MHEVMNSQRKEVFQMIIDRPDSFSGILETEIHLKPHKVAQGSAQSSKCSQWPVMVLEANGVTSLDQMSLVNNMY